MNEANIPNIIWLGAYKTDKFTNIGIPCVSLDTLDTETRKSLEKTFQTNIKVIERKSTSAQTLKVVLEFIELGGNYPPKHNLSTMESYFPTPEQFPHKLNDVFRAEITRKYLKCEMDSARENVIGLKTGEYDNHFIHKVNWSEFQIVEGQQHNQNEENLTLIENEEAQPITKTEEQKPVTSQELQKPKIVKVQDERQMDRDARKDNSTQSIAGNIITELYKQGRFPQFTEYTDIVHIGIQVKVLSEVLQSTDDNNKEQLRLIHNKYVDYLENEDISNSITWSP